MSVVVMLRPMALASFMAVTVTALVPTSGPATAQQYQAPYNASVPRPGTPYAPPPNMAGARSDRRALDNSYRPPQQDYGYPVTRPGIWQGFYVGGNASYVIGSHSPHRSLDTIDLSGGSVGLHAGYNWQFRDLVLGVEGDAAWANVDGSRTFHGPLWVTSNSDWLASVRGRAGYAMNNILLYATAGIAWTGADLIISDAASSVRASDTLFGYVVGGGIEWKFSHNMSARVEGLHYGFNDHNFKFSNGSLKVDSEVTTVRAGLTFHFN